MKNDTKFNSKKKEIIDRVKHIENAINIAQEYLKTGNHAHWHGFRALFVEKKKNGEHVHPHKDWVKNVFLPRNEKALKEAEDKLEKLMKSNESFKSESQKSGAY